MFDATEDCFSYELCSGVADLFCKMQIGSTVPFFFNVLLGNLELDLHNGLYYNDGLHNGLCCNDGLL